MKKLTLLLIAILGCIHPASAQTGLHTYGPGTAHTVISTQDGGFLLVANPTKTSTIFTKTSYDGSLQWQQTFPDWYGKPVQTGNNTILLLGAQEFTRGSRTDSSIMILRRIDLQGNLLSIDSFTKYTQSNPFTAFNDGTGGLWVIGTSVKDTVVDAVYSNQWVYISNRHTYWFWMHLDSLGNEIDYYEHRIMQESHEGQYNALVHTMGRALRDDLGRFYILSSAESHPDYWTGFGWSSRVARFDPGAAFHYYRYIPRFQGTDRQIHYALDLFPNSYQPVTAGWAHWGSGFCANPSEVSGHIAVWRSDSAIVQREGIFGITGYDENIRAVLPRPDGKFIVAGFKRDCPSTYQGIIYRVDSNLTTYTNITPNIPGNFKIFDAINVGSDIVCVGILGAFQMLLRVDSLGRFQKNMIEGRMFLDHNLNGLQDSAEAAIPNWPINFNGGSSWTNTDSTGYYSLLVNPGSHIVIPGSLFGTPALSAPAAGFHQFGLNAISPDTVQADFAVAIQDTCPIILLDLVASGWRFCQTNVSAFTYQNVGTQIATNLTVTLTLDPLIHLDTASVPYVVLGGNSIEFFLGNLPPGAAGTVTFSAYADCDSTAPGMILCASVLSSIDTLCGITNPFWDGATLDVSATCSRDSVIFEVKNLGHGNAVTPAAFTIYENLSPIRTGLMQLMAADSDSVVVADGGLSHSMVIQQSTNHPYANYAVGVIDQCQFPPNPLYNPSHVNGLVQGAAGIGWDEACISVIAAVDPNDKLANPIGWTPDHYIHHDEIIEYTVRFQNTGTDTAFNIRVLDTLSPSLDYSTLQPVGASHPWRLVGNPSGCTSWFFDHIQLPDSSTNELLSHGFFKYRIRLKPGLPQGTIIRNKAAIYFDFNGAIVTNETFHQINDSFFLTGPSQPVEVHPQAPPSPNEITIYPNPFSNELNIDLNLNNLSYGIHIQLWDITGRVILEHPLKSHHNFIDTAHLPPGIYMFRISSYHRTLHTGKLIHNRTGG